MLLLLLLAAVVGMAAAVAVVVAVAAARKPAASTLSLPTVAAAMVAATGATRRMGPLFPMCLPWPYALVKHEEEEEASVQTSKRNPRAALCVRVCVV